MPYEGNEISNRFNSQNSEIYICFNSLDKNMSNCCSYRNNKLSNLFNNRDNEIPLCFNSRDKKIFNCFNYRNNTISNLFNNQDNETSICFNSRDKNMSNCFNYRNNKISNLFNNQDNEIPICFNFWDNDMLNCFNCSNNKLSNLFNNQDNEIPICFNSRHKNMSNCFNYRNNKISNLFNSLDNKMSNCFNSWDKKMSNCVNFKVYTDDSNMPKNSFRMCKNITETDISNTSTIKGIMQFVGGLILSSLLSACTAQIAYSFMQLVGSTALGFCAFVYAIFGLLWFILFICFAYVVLTSSLMPLLLNLLVTSLYLMFLFLNLLMQTLHKRSKTFLFLIAFVPYYAIISAALYLLVFFLPFPTAKPFYIFRGFLFLSLTIIGLFFLSRKSKKSWLWHWQRSPRFA